MILPAAAPATKPLPPEEQHRALPAPLDLPRGQRPSQDRPPMSVAAGVRQDQTRSYTSKSVAGSRHDSYLANLPNDDFQHKPGLGRHLEERNPRDYSPPPPLPQQAAPQRTKSVYAAENSRGSVGGGRNRSVHADEFVATSRSLPMQSQRPAERDSRSTKAEPGKSRAASQGPPPPPPASERRPSSTKTEVPKSKSLPHQADWKPPQEKYDDPFGGAKSVKASTQAVKSVVPSRADGAKSEKAYAQPARSVGGAKSAAPTQSVYAKSEAPVSRYVYTPIHLLGGPVKSNPILTQPPQQTRPSKIRSPSQIHQNRTSQIPRPLSSSSSNNKR